MVRDAIGESPLEPLKEMVDDGQVLISAWVHEDEVTNYRVTARSRDGWRKSADAKTLDAAIRAAQAADYSAPSQVVEIEDDRY